MKPKRIILVRHGESEGNINDSIYSHTPDYALELTRKGREQSITAGKKLYEIIGTQSVFFYVSPFWRTRSTFTLIRKAFDPGKVAHLEEPRIREQEWGHLRTADETRELITARERYGHFYYRFPEGESAADVYDRVSDFFGSLSRDFNKEAFPDNAVLVTHGMTIRLFLMRWFHWTVEEFELLANPANCDLLILELQSDNHYRLLCEPKRYKKPTHTWQRPLDFRGE